MKLLRAIWRAIWRVHGYQVRDGRRRERFLRVTNYQYAIRKWFALKALARRNGQRRTP